MLSRSRWLPPPSRALPVAHGERAKWPVLRIKLGRTTPDEFGSETVRAKDEWRTMPPPLLPHIPPIIISVVTRHVLELEDTSVGYTSVHRREKTESASHPHHLLSADLPKLEETKRAAPAHLLPVVSAEVPPLPLWESPPGVPLPHSGRGACCPQGQDGLLS